MEKLINIPRVKFLNKNYRLTESKNHNDIMKLSFQKT